MQSRQAQADSSCTYLPAHNWKTRHDTGALRVLSVTQMAELTAGEQDSTARQTVTITYYAAASCMYLSNAIQRHHGL